MYKNLFRYAFVSFFVQSVKQQPETKKRAVMRIIELTYCIYWDLIRYEEKLLLGADGEQRVLSNSKAFKASCVINGD
jgi:hypothetical protein